MFKKLYDNVLEWSGHPRAPQYLAGVSFAESIFFPIPTDVMLIPMMLAKPAQAWRLAFICTVASVIGGLVGYALGRWGFNLIEAWLQTSVYYSAFLQATEAFDRWGFWVILVAGFTPIPYKVFTLAAGVVGMPFLPFLAGSAIGRSGRYFLEAAIIRLWGDSAADQIRRWIDWIGWGVVIAIVVIISYLTFLHPG